MIETVSTSSTIEINPYLIMVQHVGIFSFHCDRFQYFAEQHLNILLYKLNLNIFVINHNACGFLSDNIYVWLPRETTALKGFFKNELAIVY